MDGDVKIGEGIIGAWRLLYVESFDGGAYARSAVEISLDGVPKVRLTLHLPGARPTDAIGELGALAERWVCGREARSPEWTPKPADAAPAPGPDDAGPVVDPN